MKDEKKKIIVNNKNASYEYFIIEKYEAGISLAGTEVKSVRKGKANLKDSYAFVKNNEVFISNMHISPYEQGNIQNKDPLRRRKLLLHKSQIRSIRANLEQDGYTLIPLNLHFNGPYVKMDIAVAKGKKLHDKRASIKEKDAKRNVLAHLKNEYR